MTERKTIVVVGATGAQGGGLVRAIQEDERGAYRVRAVTRQPGSEKGRALAAAGVEVVAGDLDDQGSLERAFEGAYGAFCVTNFWEHFSPEREQVQARAMADAARRCGVNHVVWSTLEDTRQWVPLSDTRMPTLMGKYKTPHFDAKGEMDAYFTGRVPTTCLRTSFYWDNLIFFGMGPKRGPDGVLAITMPMGDARLPGIAVEDIGRCTYGIFKRGPEFIGKTVGIAGEHLTGAQMASSLARALGQPVRYNDVPPEVYRGFGFPGADDLGNMFQVKRDFNREYCANRTVEFSRGLHPGVQTFDAWLGRNKSRIPLE